MLILIGQKCYWCNWADIFVTLQEVRGGQNVRGLPGRQQSSGARLSVHEKATIKSFVKYLKKKGTDL